MTTMVAHEWTTSKIATTVVCMTYLCLIPFYNPQTEVALKNTLSGAGVLAAIYLVEDVLKLQQALTAYLIVMIIFRCFHYKCFYCSVAMIATTLERYTAISYNFPKWYVCLASCERLTCFRSSISPRLCLRFYYDRYAVTNAAMIVFFLFTLLVDNVYSRASGRIWDHITLLMIYRDKYSKEAELCNTIIRAHLPGEIIEHIVQKSGGAHEDDTDEWEENTSGSIPITSPCPIVAAAISLNVLPKKGADVLTASQLQAVDGIERCNVTILVIKDKIGADGDCESKSSADSHEALFLNA